MSHIKALELAGFEILVYEEFGSYQGEWLVKVCYQGKKGWLIVPFGSCSGCDEVEGIASMHGHRHEDGAHFSVYRVFDSRMECDRCDAYIKDLTEYGKYFIDLIETQEEIERKVERNKWDMETKEMLAYVQKESWEDENNDQE